MAASRFERIATIRRYDADHAPASWEKSYPPGVVWDTPIVVGTLPALLDRAVATYADKPAFEYREQLISFADYGRRVKALAAGRMRLGIAKGDRVALYLPNCPAQPVALFAAVQIGAIVVNLSPLDAEREFAHKLKDSGARTLITTNIGLMADVALRIKAAGLVDRLIVADDAEWGPSPATSPMPERSDSVLTLDDVASALPLAVWPEVVPDDIALLNTPAARLDSKGAILSHANLPRPSDRQGVVGASVRRQPGEAVHLRAAAVSHVCHHRLPTRGLDFGSLNLLRRFDVE